MSGNYLKILAFGDSLTSWAYTDELERIVRVESKNNSAVVKNAGHLGWETFYLEKALKESLIGNSNDITSIGRPHIATILGGTNDLGLAALKFLDSDAVIGAFNEIYPKESMTPEKIIELANIEIVTIKSGIIDSQIDQSAIADFFKGYMGYIFGNLVSMYSQAIRRGVFPIAIAVPPANVEGFSRKLMVAPRITLNEMIRGYCIEHDIAYVDLFSATANPETGLMLPEYSADGLHFNKAGYQEMARVVFEQGVLPFLQQSPIKRMLRRVRGKIFPVGP